MSDLQILFVCTVVTLNGAFIAKSTLLGCFAAVLFIVFLQAAGAA